MSNTQSKLPFRMGDECTYIGKLNWANKHIIYEANFVGNSFEYSTDKGAWIPHKDLRLTKECSTKSLHKLRKVLDEEGLL